MELEGTWRECVCPRAPSLPSQPCAVTLAQECLSSAPGSSLGPPGASRVQALRMRHSDPSPQPSEAHMGHKLPLYPTAALPQHRTQCR